MGIRVSCLAIVALTMVTSIEPAWAGETIAYTYDALGRLTTAVHSGSANNGLQQSYSYDKAGNRTNVTVTGSPVVTIVRHLPVPLGGAVLILAP